jgi:hypothetical protein
VKARIIEKEKESKTEEKVNQEKVIKGLAWSPPKGTDRLD